MACRTSPARNAVCQRRSQNLGKQGTNGRCSGHKSIARITKDWHYWKSFLAQSKAFSEMTCISIANSVPGIAAAVRLSTASGRIAQQAYCRDLADQLQHFGNAARFARDLPGFAVVLLAVRVELVGQLLDGQRRILGGLQGSRAGQVSADRTVSCRPLPSQAASRRSYSCRDSADATCPGKFAGRSDDAGQISSPVPAVLGKRKREVSAWCSPVLGLPGAASVKRYKTQPLPESDSRTADRRQVLR